HDGLWALHCKIDVAKLPEDPHLLALIDFNLCLDRAASLLVEPGPTPAKLEEAHRLLDLVVSQRPEMRTRVQYWKAVAHRRAPRAHRAADVLSPRLTGPDAAPAAPARRFILLQAGQLALLLHEELRRRVGIPALHPHGRRLEAIAAVERHLSANPDDKGV